MPALLFEEDSIFTAREYLLYQCLCMCAGGAVTRRYLHATLYGMQSTVSDRAVDIAISRLRKKLAMVNTSLCIACSEDGYRLFAREP